jgi:hypothetical protein
MNFLCMIGLAVTLVAPPGKKTFANYEYGLTFDYPDTWQVSTKKDYSKFLIPLEGGGKAELYLHSALFNRDIETWMYVQKDIVLQMKREVVSQTQEEIMGVPLLITKSRYTEKESSMVSVSGLVYSATARKMLYRLVATEASIDQANQAFNAVLQTIRTTTGKQIKTEDPNRKVDPKDIKNVDNHAPAVTRIEGQKTKTGELKKGSVVVVTEAAGRSVNLRLPEGWAGEKQADGSIVIKHPELSMPLVVKINGILDSDPATKALFRQSSRSLDEFENVTKREEPKPATNSGGALVYIVWRTGKNGKGDLYTCDAAGSLGDYYWLFSYRSVTSNIVAADRRTIEALVKTMSVEPSE